MLLDKYIDAEFVAVLLKTFTLIESQFRNVLMLYCIAGSKGRRFEVGQFIKCQQHLFAKQACSCRKVMEKLNNIVISQH